MSKNITARLVKPESGYDLDRENIKVLGLQVGQEFIVESIDVGNWHTSIRLEGYDKSFNSVNFEFFVEGNKIDIFNYISKFIRNRYRSRV